MRTASGPLAALLLLAATAHPAAAAVSTACARLGDGVGKPPDRDTFRVLAPAGTVQVTLEARPDAGNRGTRALLRASGARRRGALPLSMTLMLDGDGDASVSVRQLGARGRGFTGRYCLRVERDGLEVSVEPLGDVEVEWVALAADRGSVFPPFLPVTDGDWAGAIQPIVPLVGDRVYAVVVTTRVRDHDGRRLEADAAFAAALGVAPRSRGGPVARFAADPEAPGNPYPDGRLVQTDGTIRIPDHVAWDGVPVDDPALAAARADLRAVADGLEQLHGFSPVQPIRIALSRPVDIATVRPKTVLVFERTDRALDLPGLLAAIRSFGLRARDVAVAVSFPTLDVEAGHRALGARLDALDASSPIAAILEDPDPGDDLPIGVFDESSAEYGSYLAAHPEIARVVVGLLPSREFRGDDGLLSPARLDGTDTPPVVPLDFVLTLPASGTPPYPVVIFQHGFAGSNQQVLSRVGPVLARHGLATIGIDAASHGRRGNFLDLLTGSAFQLRDIFRQTNADQMALVRMIRRGIHVDADAASDLDATRIGYLGISMGGLAGGPFVASEPAITAAVLNVMSGRTALNGLNTGTRPIYASYYSARVGLDAGTPEFEAYLAQTIALGQHAADPSDSLNFAQRWWLAPFVGTPRTPVLVQQGVDDPLVWNVLTEELAMVAGLPTNVPQRDADGVAGHWIFDDPGGHDIFAREDVQEQAAVFLASDGRDLLDPTAP
ncbi:MAG TPA: alpha/beta hydrolase [Candidatus Limnocylindria bacterium]|nr:alpha/beta hydrolase [Candidatus Limnocylindria bacterium]